MLITDKHVFFWGGEFSNWHLSDFEWRGINFNCAEQAMMWCKADVFGDTESKKLILAEKNPRNQKKLGRQVVNFDDTIWSLCRYDLAISFLYAKYSQKENLRKLLIETHPKILVEASPYDTIWGIGMGIEDYSQADLDDESKWRGMNLLGRALTQVRQSLI
jgi:ribA/ribD-fused uncharacterized protein